MKTLICTEPRILKYEIAAKPELRKGHSILKIRRIGICGTGLHAFEGTQPFFTYPRILGHELSGEITDPDGAPAFETGEPATGNLKAINNAFQYMAHGGRYVLIGLQKTDIHFSHPEFHKREGTLMSSRNATRQDFEHVKVSIEKADIIPGNYITHQVLFHQVKDEFESWLDPATGVVKAMISI